MRNLDYLLKNKTINYHKLIEYGFIKNKDSYIYKKKIYNNQFELIIGFSNNKNYSRLIEIETNEDYILVDINANGKYVSNIKKELENELNILLEKIPDLKILLDFSIELTKLI